MFPINDALDAILIGMFFFGILFSLGSLLLGVADIDFGGDSDVGDAGGEGHFAGLFNVSSLVAFVTWFGGVAYLARNALDVWTWLALVIGVAGGFAAASLISWLLINVLRKNSQEMNPADWNPVGVIGRVTSSIRESGFGEIVYEQHGSRHVASARGEGNSAIPRNTEVVILRVERGVAIVKPFEELLASHDDTASSRLQGP